MTRTDSLVPDTTLFQCDRGADPATLREVGAEAVRAADEKAGGIERVKFGIKVVEADADRGGVADLLVDPRLVEPQRADPGLDIAHRLGVAGQFADRAAIVIEAKIGRAHV